MTEARKSSKAIYAFMSAPLLVLMLWVGFLFHAKTRAAALWMLKENHPVELLTFAVALSGGILGLALARRAGKHGEKPFVSGFYALVASALVFIAMEEIAWGQQFFGFDSPAAWASINLQGETTLHNVAGMQGRSEIFRLIFGLLGLVGVGLSFYPYFRKISAPVILLPWFVVITLHAGVDVYNDFFPIENRFDLYVQRTSELVELLIAISAFLYITLNSKILSTGWKWQERPGL